MSEKERIIKNLKKGDELITKLAREEISLEEFTETFFPHTLDETIEFIESNTTQK